MEYAQLSYDAPNKDAGASCSIPKLRPALVAKALIRFLLHALRRPLGTLSAARISLAVSRGKYAKAQRLAEGIRWPQPTLFMLVAITVLCMSERREARAVGGAVCKRYRASGKLPYSFSTYWLTACIKDEQYDDLLKVARLRLEKEKGLPNEITCDALVRALHGLKRYEEALAVAQWLIQFHPQSECLAQWVHGLRALTAVLPRI